MTNQTMRPLSSTQIIVLCLLSCCALAALGCSSEASAPPPPSPEPTATPRPTKEVVQFTIEGATANTPHNEPVETVEATTEPTITPTLAPLPIPTPSGAPFIFHTVQAGQTLGWLTVRYDTTMDVLTRLNNLSGPEAIIQIGQVLRVPLDPDIPHASAEVMWPDSEVVYSPAYVDFDTAAFIEEQGGYLASYTETVDGQEMDSAQVIERVAERFSVGPRLLLTVLEYYGEWVTNPNPTSAQISRPTGPNNPHQKLYLMLGWTAKKINAGYYGYKRDGFWVLRLADYNLALAPQGMNAGTVGVLSLLALHSDEETWAEATGESGLMATYQQLFGDPADYALDAPLVPSNLTQPEMGLPWREGQGFYFTAGPHIAYVDGSAWAAIDFGPPDVLGSCYFSNEPNTAVADGTILVARQGEVQLDLDGDGQIQTGWVVLYLHVALDVDIPLQVGQNVKTGDVVGYASCEGGEANSSHLHVARRYNGEWIEAGGPIPFDLSGWVVQPNRIPYDGVMRKGDLERASCECWAEKNLIVNE